MKLLTDPYDIDRQQWQELIASSPIASIFQTPEMYGFYASLNLYEAKVIAIEDNGLKGLVVCVTHGGNNRIKKWFTSRTIINGGPLFSEDISEEALNTLLKATVKLLKRSCIYIETRNLNDYSRWRDTFEKCGFKYVPHYNFHIDTTDAEQVDKRMDKSRRRRIRRAFEHGAHISDDARHLPDFYKILSTLYHEKIHKPLPPYSLFEQLVSKPFARYFFVLDETGKTIGGQLILTLGQRVAYAWYCCGLDKEFHDLYPSIVANYAAIRYAADNGFQRFDMMGAGKPGEAYGVRDFKAQFGGTLVEHGRFLRVNKPLIYGAATMALNLLGKMKAEKKTPRYIKNELPLFNHHSRRGTLADD